MMDWNGWGDGGFWMMAIVWIGFVSVVVVGIVLVVRGLSPNSGGGSRPVEPADRETAEEIVRRRYAAGEIDREEYEQKLRDLHSRSAA